MAEILFRGFHKDENGNQNIILNGEYIKGYWVYGYYIKHLPYTPAPMARNVEKVKKQIEKDTVHCIAKDSFSDCGTKRSIDMLEVIKETVGQYTGLNDINGYKIFTGDLITWENVNELGEINKVSPYEVILSDKYYYGFVAQKEFKRKTGITFLQFSFIEIWKKNIKIVGNIYDKSQIESE